MNINQTVSPTADMKEQNQKHPHPASQPTGTNTEPYQRPSPSMVRASGAASLHPPAAEPRRERRERKRRVETGGSGAEMLREGARYWNWRRWGEPAFISTGADVTCAHTHRCVHPRGNATHTLIAAVLLFIRKTQLTCVWMRAPEDLLRIVTCMCARSDVNICRGISIFHQISVHSWHNNSTETRLLVLLVRNSRKSSESCEIRTSPNPQGRRAGGGAKTTLKIHFQTSSLQTFFFEDSLDYLNQKSWKSSDFL